MKNFLQKIKDLYSHIREGRSPYQRKGIRPIHDWRVIIANGFLLAICITVFSLYIYIGVDRGELFTIPVTDMSGQVSINDTLLKKVTDKANLRADNLKAIESGKKTLPDPSL